MRVLEASKLDDFEALVACGGCSDPMRPRSLEDPVAGHLALRIGPDRRMIRTVSHSGHRPHGVAAF
jgi:hypothetical protein